MTSRVCKAPSRSWTRSRSTRRFFSFRKSIPERAFERIAEIDFVHLAGLVVTIGSGADETIIGGASYVGRSDADGAKVAEVAFTIEEDFQGQGLASRLLAALVMLARRHGLVRFEAEVLSGNAPMLAVFQRSGLPLRQRRESGVIHLDLDLAPAPAEAGGRTTLRPLPRPCPPSQEGAPATC